MLPKVIGGKSVERNSFRLERYYFNPLLDEVDTPKIQGQHMECYYASVN